MKKPKIISKIKEQAINVESPWLLRLWANFNNLWWNEFSCKNSQKTNPLLICTWILKNQVDELDFSLQKSISKLILAGYTGSKNPVRRTWFLQIDFSEIKYRSTGGKSHLRYTIRTLEIVNKRRIKLKLSMKVHLPHTQEPWSTIVPGKKLPLNHPNEIYRLVQNSDALLAQSYQSEAVTDHPSTSFWQILGPNRQSGLV